MKELKVFEEPEFTIRLLSMEDVIITSYIPEEDELPPF